MEKQKTQKRRAIVAICNQKGGVGKTTTCVNLVAALHYGGHKPLAIDMDPQGHLGLASGLVQTNPPFHGVERLFQKKEPLSELFQNTPLGWKVVPASLELTKIDTLYGADPKAALILKKALSDETFLTKNPILIDCSPALGVLSLNALIAADRVLIPVSSDFLSLQGMHRLSAALSVLEGKLGRPIERKIVVTRFDARRQIAHDIFNKLKDTYGDMVCNTKIMENVVLTASFMHGKDVFSFSPQSQGALDYRALTIELGRAGFFEVSGK